MRNNNLAPIVVFTYNRPEHLKNTISALKKNYLSKKSKLIIYSDGPKDANDIGVSKVRKYLKGISGFKTITTIINANNIGLANSIIKGVTEVINKYGKVIILEDDIVTSPYFLKYMNDALDKYQNEKKVWHISGWNYPLLLSENKKSFLWRMMSCWGWGTWKDRWVSFEKNADKNIKAFSKNEIFKFNIDGTAEENWGQILENKRGNINTWAIFWYATIFKQKGLCLNPSISYTENIGMDGSGEHCINEDDLLSLKGPLSTGEFCFFPDLIIEDEFAIYQLKKFLKLNQIIHKYNKIFKSVDVDSKKYLEAEDAVSRLKKIYNSKGWKILSKIYRLRDNKIKNAITTLLNRK